jgi:hypothetical protein
VECIVKLFGDNESKRIANTDPWSCYICDPTSVNSKYEEKMQSLEESSLYTSALQRARENKDNNTEEEIEADYLRIILEELESEKLAVEERLDDDNFMKELEMDIKDEISNGYASIQFQ